MKLIRRWYWTFTGFFKKYAIGIGVSALLGILVMSLAPRLVHSIPISKTQYIGRTGSYTMSTMPIDIQQKVSRGLTSIEEDGSYSLDIAQSIEISEDGLTYTITMNPQTYWSTGERMTSFNVNLSLPDVEVSRPHDSVLVFKLKEPFTPFPNIIAQPILRRVTVGTINKRTEIIGTENYRITDVTTQNQYISRITLQSPSDKIIYRFYTTENDAMTAFKLGHIDQIDHLTAPYLEDWPNVRVEQNQQTNRYLSLFFNTRDPDLQNKTIRQMLTYATPKKTGQERIISPISKHSWAYNPQVKPYDHSLEAAQNILDRMKETNADLELSFEITTTPAYTDMANRIIDSWQQIGIDANLKIVPYIDTNDYQILLIGQMIPDDPDQYLLWHSTQPTNITRYQSPKIDKLLEDGRQDLEQETRRQIYQEFQRFLVEDSPAAFLHELNTFTLYRN